MASSARLCFIDFCGTKHIKFELPLKNDLINSNPTKMDAVIDNDFYECKCQEILEKSHSGFHKSYLESSLFKEFRVSKSIIEEKHEKDQNGKINTYYVLGFTVDELGINLAGNPDYHKLRFDLKQLICHLIAIANNYGTETTLNYIFYKPANIEIEKYKSVHKMYEDLEIEIKAIWNSANILNFCEKHKIKLPKPIYKTIDTIEGFVFPKAFNK